MQLPMNATLMGSVSIYMQHPHIHNLSTTKIHLNMFLWQQADMSNSWDLTTYTAQFNLTYTNHTNSKINDTYSVFQHLKKRETETAMCKT